MTARLVVFAPNWLGDAVMALPAIADVRRGAAGRDDRRRRAPVDRAALHAGAGHRRGRDARASARRGADAIASRPADTTRRCCCRTRSTSARMAWRAGIPERWGYRTDCRVAAADASASPPPTRVHQAEYYQHLMRALGFAGGSATEPRLERVRQPSRSSGAALLARAGWDGRTPLVALAPGAAFGGAKRWPARIVRGARSTRWRATACERSSSARRRIAAAGDARCSTATHGIAGAART